MENGNGNIDFKIQLDPEQVERLKRIIDEANLNAEKQLLESLKMIPWLIGSLLFLFIVLLVYFATILL